MAQSILITGAHLVCYINGKLFGKVAGGEVVLDSSHGAINTIDTLLTVEQPPVALRGSFSLQVYRAHNDGGIETSGMVGSWLKASTQQTFSMAIVNRVTKSTVWNFEGCVTQRQQWGLRHGYVIGAISCTATQVTGEAV